MDSFRSFRAGLFTYHSYCDNMKKQLQVFQNTIHDSFDRSLQEIPSLSEPSTNLLTYYETKYKFEYLSNQYSNECKFANFLSSQFNSPPHSESK